MKSNQPAILLFSAQLFVITHGWQPDHKFPIWAQDMALAINLCQEKPESKEAIVNSIVDLSGNDKPGHSKKFIIFDWAKEANALSIRRSSKVLFDVVERRMRDAEGKIDIHFIAHSRGCYINAAVIKGIQETGNDQKVGFLRMTTLDPRTIVGSLDRTLTANPGNIVDWTDNYFQKAGSDPLKVEIPANGLNLHPDALNVNLTSIVKPWSGRTLKGKERGWENHSEVHDWYHWTWDQRDYGDLKKTPYSDFDINKQRTTFFAEKKQGNMQTRRKLYWTSPIVENFRGGITPEFQFFSGRGSHVQRIPTLIDESDVNKVKNGFLQLTSSKQWLATGTWFQGGIQGGFTVEFTFQIHDCKYLSSADGITFAILDARQPIRIPLGRVGGELGYGGLNGLAIAFDTYPNPEYKDPRITNRTVSLRANGLPLWREEFTPELPEAINSGKKFRVRISVSDEASQINLRVYSYGEDKVVTMTKTLPHGSIPKNKFVGFTCATGRGASDHRIEKVLLITSPIRAFR